MPSLGRYTTKRNMGSGLAFPRSCLTKHAWFGVMCTYIAPLTGVADALGKNGCVVAVHCLCPPLSIRSPCVAFRFWRRCPRGLGVLGAECTNGCVSQMIHDILSTVASLPDVSLGTCQPGHCPWPTTLTLGRPSFTIAFPRGFRSAVVIPLPANEGPHGIPPSVRPLVSFRDTFFFFKPSLKSPKRQNSDSVGSRQESSNSLNNGWG